MSTITLLGWLLITPIAAWFSFWFLVTAYVELRHRVVLWRLGRARQRLEAVRDLLYVTPLDGERIGRELGVASRALLKASKASEAHERANAARRRWGLS